ncbi:MAG TPA: type II toxin-antitoxin system VapC family toxin [bacterium]|nr:type II toxin-antitoxin system VapC family toxin [bacterium]HPN45626.1 type II toxin-antitoxin system VapC family toxin [bacterium]
MNYILDTNTCIKYLNGSSSAIKKKLESVDLLMVNLCSVVKAELIYGAMKSQKPRENLIKIEYFMNRFNSFPFNDKAAQLYGLIRSTLEKSGEIIGPNDLFIASIALANNCVLVTNNTKKFKRIKSIKLQDWEE